MDNAVAHPVTDSHLIHVVPAAKRIRLYRGDVPILFEDVSAEVELFRKVAKLDFTKDNKRIGETSNDVKVTTAEQQQQQQQQQQTKWPFEEAENLILQAKMEAEVLCDVLQLAFDKRYLAAKVVREPSKEPRNPFVQLAMLQQTMLSMSTYLQQGSQRLGDSATVSSQHHADLVELMRRWHIRSDPKYGLLVDLGYRTAGCMYHSEQFDFPLRIHEGRWHIDVVQQHRTSKRLQLTMSDSAASTSAKHCANHLSVTALLLDRHRVSSQGNLHRSLQIAHSSLFVNELFTLLGRGAFFSGHFESPRISDQVITASVSEPCQEHGVEMRITMQEFNDADPADSTFAVAGRAELDSAVLETVAYSVLRHTHAQDWREQTVFDESRKARSGRVELNLLNTIVNSASHIHVWRRVATLLDQVAKCHREPYLRVQWSQYGNNKLPAIATLSIISAVEGTTQTKYQATLTLSTCPTHITVALPSRETLEPFSNYDIELPLTIDALFVEYQSAIFAEEAKTKLWSLRHKTTGHVQHWPRSMSFESPDRLRVLRLEFTDGLLRDIQVTCGKKRSLFVSSMEEDVVERQVFVWSKLSGQSNRHKFISLLQLV